jgi:hypothetical protein
MSLKTKGDASETKPRQPQNEAKLSVEMRALSAECALCDGLHVLARASIAENGRFEIAPKRGIQRATGNYKNRGNEAKEYLKTKDITFLNGSNLARFARKLARI